MWSPEDFILHYAARRFLCSTSQAYHVTDVSKSAMAVDKAQVDRHARYARWSDLLDEEIRLVAKPRANIVAIGQEVRRFLGRHTFDDRPVTSILHYSAQANAARNAAVLGREAEFRAFSATLSMQEVLEVAAEVMEENSLPATMSPDTIPRLRKAKLSESRRKLASIYATAFAELR